MSLLLDTHVVLWWLDDSPELRTSVREAIRTEPDVLVSAAVVWEISIKAARGKLKVIPDFAEYLRATRFAELPITWHHGKLAGGLPRHHDDPFDRLLVAQAQSEGLTLVTRDGALRRYEVDLFPA